MKLLLKNAKVVDVFTDTLMDGNVLIEDDRIIGIGDYSDKDADISEDLTGKWICPGFIDGHIHIESSMLSPLEFAKAGLPHGTTTIIADPHEIANVSGLTGISYMLEASEGLPMNMLFVMPSCVPATPFDEAGAVLSAADIAKFYGHPRVVGLGEVMNYPGVVARDPELMAKLSETAKHKLVSNGHAPMLSGRDLDSYISAGIYDDHECSTFEEAAERIHKGQWIMIRQGTAARNLEGLIGLFDGAYSYRCLLVTDDKHPADLIQNGHIDSIIRYSAELGKNPLIGIRMATIQAAARFGLKEVGAIAPGYSADIVVLDDIDTVKVSDVYCKGEKVVDHGVLKQIDAKPVQQDILNTIRNSFFMDPVSPESFHIEEQGTKCRVIGVLPDQLITNEEIMDIDFSKNNGIDISSDILKLAVIERHKNTGHIGIGLIHGIGLKSGAIASSVSHDSHNLIVIGTSEEDMAAAANRIREMGGGLAVVDGGKVIAELALPLGGLMGAEDARSLAAENQGVRDAAKQLGANENIEPFMNMAFVSLPVIPNLKMTTHGLIDVNKQKLVSLFV